MQIWLITGCSSGLGRCLAFEALRRGYNVVVTARNPNSLTEFSERYPGQALIQRMDVTKPEEIQQVIRNVGEAFGPIDVLVNNAGYGYRAAGEEGEAEAVERLFQTNLFGPITLTKAVLPDMRRRRSGAIVNIASVAAAVPSVDIDSKSRKEHLPMKKLAAIILSSILVLSLAACSNNQQGGEAAQAPASQTGDAASTPAAGDNESEESTVTEGVASDGNTLIAYFSVPETDGVDAVAGASRVVVDGEVLGNNQYIARLIQQETGGDLFRIETVQEYPGSHDPLLEFAYNERAEGARPELATQIENLDRYDVIFLGYPNWNADLPMPLYTFLEEYDFSGKTIIPFTTHGGSGFSRTIQTIQELQPDATIIEDGLSISRNSVPDAQADVMEWITGLNL